MGGTVDDPLRTAREAANLSVHARLAREFTVAQVRSRSEALWTATWRRLVAALLAPQELAPEAPQRTLPLA